MENKHIIWSDMNLDFNDWRDDLKQYYPEASEDEPVSYTHLDVYKRQGIICISPLEGTERAKHGLI